MFTNSYSSRRQFQKPRLEPSHNKQAHSSTILFSSTPAIVKMVTVLLLATFIIIASEKQSPSCPSSHTSMSWVNATPLWPVLQCERRSHLIARSLDLTLCSQTVGRMSRSNNSGIRISIVEARKTEHLAGGFVQLFHKNKKEKFTYTLKYLK